MTENRDTHFSELLQASVIGINLALVQCIILAGRFSGVNQGGHLSRCTGVTDVSLRQGEALTADNIVRN